MEKTNEHNNTISSSNSTDSSNDPNIKLKMLVDRAIYKLKEQAIENNSKQIDVSMPNLMKITEDIIKDLEKENIHITAKDIINPVFNKIVIESIHKDK